MHLKTGIKHAFGVAKPPFIRKMTRLNLPEVIRPAMGQTSSVYKLYDTLIQIVD